MQKTEEIVEVVKNISQSTIMVSKLNMLARILAVVKCKELSEMYETDSEGMYTITVKLGDMGHDVYEYSIDTNHSSNPCVIETKKWVRFGMTGKKVDAGQSKTVHYATEYFEK